jgi:hypothetical protein
MAKLLIVRFIIILLWVLTDVICDCDKKIAKLSRIRRECDPEAGNTLSNAAYTCLTMVPNLTHNPKLCSECSSSDNCYFIVVFLCVKVTFKGKTVLFQSAIKDDDQIFQWILFTCGIYSFPWVPYIKWIILLHNVEVVSVRMLRLQK